MPVTVAEALADAVRRHGVGEIFAQSVPSAFVLAAEARGIRQIGYRTENAGGAMADGFSRISHRPAVVAAQNGPAATLLVPPLSEAYAASTAVVAVVQDVATTHRDRNAFQELDHFALFASCAKWVRRLDDPTRVDDYVDMAFTAAGSGRPGPVVLLVPKDVLVKHVSPRRARTARLAQVPVDRPRPDARVVREAAGLLAAARRPLVVAGGGVHGSDATEVLAKLQVEVALPVVTTVMGKGAVAEDDPLSAGVIGHFMGPGGMTHGLIDWFTGVDVVLLVGTRTNENGTDSWRTLPDKARYIHLDVSGLEVGRNYEALRLVGDARAGLADLLAELRMGDLSRRWAARDEVTSVVAAGRRDHRDRISPHGTSAVTPIRPERVMRELDQLLTDDAIVAADASYSSIWVANYLLSRRAGQRFLTPRGLAGLGWGLPLALGAKAARPAAPVVCVTGDGGFAHCWAELETAVRERLPIVVMVLNNAVLGHQQHAEVHQFGAATSVVEFTRIDHAAIAQACGAAGIRITDPNDLGDALTKALIEDRPVVLDILTDPTAFPPFTGWETDTRLPTILEEDFS